MLVVAGEQRDRLKAKGHNKQQKKEFLGAHIGDIRSSCGKRQLKIGEVHCKQRFEM